MVPTVAATNTGARQRIANPPSASMAASNMHGQQEEASPKKITQRHRSARRPARLLTWMTTSLLIERRTTA